MFRVTKSIDIDFAHFIAGHEGNCVNVHGHTWKFEVTLAGSALNETGFVADFGDIKNKVLVPVHSVLDHSMLMGQEMFEKSWTHWDKIGRLQLATRTGLAREPIGAEPLLIASVEGVQLRKVGGMRITTSPFNPTSERLAEWLYRATHTLISTNAAISGSDLRVDRARVYETLHPVESFAEFSQY